MYIVVRRGAFETIDEGGRLAGIAAVRVLHEFAEDPDLQDWLPRPGKVVLRARSPAPVGARARGAALRRRPTASSRCRRAGAPSAARR